jgi:hypothetical protein
MNWVELDPDDDQPSTDISLRPERVIHGQLIDLQGQPAAGVEVSAPILGRLPFDRQANARDSSRSVLVWPTRVTNLWAWPQPVKSDAQGRFTVRGLARDLQARLVILDTRYAEVLHTLTTDSAGDAQKITVSLQPSRTITGHVTHADTGQPAPHARVQTGSLSAEAETDAEGRFHMPGSSRNREFITVYPSQAHPYLAVEQQFEWNPGEIRHSLAFALPRGVLLRGKVVEEGSGQPVVGANLIFQPKSTQDAGNTIHRSETVTGSDGSFQFGVSPRPGLLIVNGPSAEYVLRDFSKQMSARPGRGRTYEHACLSIDPKPDSSGSEIQVALRRGRTLAGCVVDPEGRPVETASMISVITSYDGLTGVFTGRFRGSVRRGRFHVFGLDPEAETPVYFLEPQRKLGATVRLTGKSDATESMTVRLEACGKAQGRLVDENQKPVPGTKNTDQLTRALVLASMVVTPGSPFYLRRATQQPSDPPADEGTVTTIDPTNYSTRFTPDAEGRISFPALIPGATYRLYDYTAPTTDGPKLRKEFVSKPGETLDLGDILIEKPPK